MEIRDAAKLGLDAKFERIEFPGIMTGMRNTISEDRDPIRENLDHIAGLDFYEEQARFVDKYVLEVSGGGIKGKKIFITSGARPLIPVKISQSIDSVSTGDFDALLIPGGYSPEKLGVHENAVKFTRDFMNSGKPVFAICHAGQLLIAADVVRGRKMTGCKSIVEDIKNAGAEFIDQLE
jgi:PfpI family intracellular protease